jgi:hypothetical protein
MQSLSFSKQLNNCFPFLRRTDIDNDINTISTDSTVSSFGSLVFIKKWIARAKFVFLQKKSFVYDSIFFF